MTKKSNLIGVYPGTFDPLTLGHLDIIKRSLKLVNKLIIGIGCNSTKQVSFFSPEERLVVIEGCLKEEFSSEEINKIEVKIFSGLLINFALTEKANIIIRGLRALSDFDFEFNLASGNQVLNPQIESIFLMTSISKQFISSKLVKEIYMLGGDISKFVPAYIKLKMLEKLPIE